MDPTVLSYTITPSYTNILVMEHYPRPGTMAEWWFEDGQYLYRSNKDWHDDAAFEAAFDPQSQG